MLHFESFCQLLIILGVLDFEVQPFNIVTVFIFGRWLTNQACVLLPQRSKCFFFPFPFKSFRFLFLFGCYTFLFCFALLFFALLFFFFVFVFWPYVGVWSLHSLMGGCLRELQGIHRNPNLLSDSLMTPQKQN